MNEPTGVTRVSAHLQAMLRALVDLGGSARLRDLLARAESQIALDPEDLEVGNRGGSQGIPRWQIKVRWHSLGAMRAGFLRKSGGKWHATELTEQAIAMDPETFTRTCAERYRAWERSRGDDDGSTPTTGDGTAPEDIEGDDQASRRRQIAYDQATEQARGAIDEHLAGLGPYDYQSLVAHLLRGMGYFVSHEAPPGPDGGIDVVAYRDPLGTVEPRIKVQVKHRPGTKASVKEVRELEGLLRKAGDIGLFVSSGGFSPDALREVRASHRHVELMDQDRLVSLWTEHYEKIPEAGRRLLPLVRVAFLAPEQEED